MGEGRELGRRMWSESRKQNETGQKEWEKEMADFITANRSVLSSLTRTCQRTEADVSLLVLSLCHFSPEEWIHLDLLVQPPICQGVINYEEGQRRIKPRNSLKRDHHYCSLQRPALSTSPEAEESIFLICSCPSSLFGRIDVSDIWNHQLTRGRIKMKKLHFAVGLDEHIWLMAISCCILCWLWLCKNFKLKFQMTEDTENIVLTPSTMRFYRRLPNMSLDSISLYILSYLGV